MSESTRYELVVNMSNAAFDDSQGVELARILRAEADRVIMLDTLPAEWRSVRDINGNSVGSARTT